MAPGRNAPCSCGSGKKFKHCCQGKALPTHAAEPPPAETNQLIALFNTGHHAEAESRTRILLARYPNSGIGWKILGAALQLQGKDALPALQKSTELAPNNAEAHYNLAVARKKRGLLHDAVVSYRRAIQLKPDYVEAHTNLGNALADLALFDDAIASYQQALTINAKFFDAHHNLGNTLQRIEQFDQAIQSYHRALEINPHSAASHFNMANALLELGQFHGAMLNFRRALEIKPDFANAHCNLGITLMCLDQPDDAIASYRRALELQPDLNKARSSMLFALNYTARYPAAYCLEKAQEYGQIVAGNISGRFAAWQCSAQPTRLRVGIVSGDLRNHPVGYFLENLVKHLDASRFELIAYSNNVKEDALSARIKPYFSVWRILTDLSDEAAARLIHADGVHALIDLSGHTRHNRLPVLAWKPAPLQISWLGYFATTGMAEVDYFIADRTGVPDAARQQFTEAIYYLPDTRLCFTPPQSALPVSLLPARGNGHVTLGCFQSLPKVGDEVLSTWGKILAAIPTARLRMQCPQLGEAAQVTRLIERLQAQGIDPARVSMHGMMPREAYLSAHAEVDFILDTFPYPGGTTTCEALWMGVPTLTLAGDSLLARQGASLLTAAGLESWVTSSTEEYIAKAIALANDAIKLADLRAILRAQTLSSALFDAPRFAQHFAAALECMWAKHTPTSP